MKTHPLITTSLIKDVIFKIFGWMTLYVLVLNPKSTIVNINLTELITANINHNVLKFIALAVDLKYLLVSFFIPRQVCWLSHMTTKLNL